MATIRSNNTKADEMKIVFNCSARVDGKNKRLKQWPVVTNCIKKRSESMMAHQASEILNRVAQTGQAAPKRDGQC